jgi:hypothetical protein
MVTLKSPLHRQAGFGCQDGRPYKEKFAHEERGRSKLRPYKEKFRGAREDTVRI